MPNLSDRATGLTNVNVLSLNQLPGDGPSASADQIKLYAKADGKVYTKILEDGEEVEKEVGSGGGASVEIIEDNTAEEFAVGDILYFDGTNYAKALASATNTAEVVGIVSEKLGSAGSYKYTVTTAGYIEEGLELDVDGDPLVAGSVYFLSADTAGGLTLNEPNVVGQVSRPVLLVSAARTEEGAANAKGFVLPYRGIVVGGSNARTSLSLNDGGSTNIQDMSDYEAGELSGWVYIKAGVADADSLRFYVEAQVSKNGVGDDYNISYQTSGDTPPSGFDMNVSAAGMVSVVLPSITGFSSANINYSLNAAAIGVDLPLSLDASNIQTGTLPSSVLPEATSSAIGAVKKHQRLVKSYTGIYTSEDSGTSIFPLSNLPAGNYKLIVGSNGYWRQQADSSCAVIIFINDSSIGLAGYTSTSGIVGEVNNVYSPTFTTYFEVSTASSFSLELVISGSGSKIENIYCVLEKLENYEEITTEWD